MAAAAGMRVLWARGSELEQGYPFGLARQLLGDAATGRVGRDELADSPAAALPVILDLYSGLMNVVWENGGGSAGTPLLVAVDDAQWADEPSLRFLAHLTLRIEAQPIALLATVRSADTGAAGELLHRLRESPAVRVLNPIALSDTAVAIVVRATLGEEAGEELIAACARATLGNPFYLHELLRALVLEPEPDPKRIAEVAPRAVLRSVVVRLARLGGDASALARAVAILGDGARLELAAQLAGLPRHSAEAAADGLSGGGVFAPGEPLRFVHPLMASALDADMGAFERSRKHRDAAQLMLAVGAPVEQVAAHLMISQPQGDARTVAVLTEAAAEAAAGGSPADAARLLRRALAEPPAPEEEPELLLACAKAEALAGSPAAVERLEEALRRIEVRDRRADALAELATLAHLQGEFARAAELARRCRAELPEDHPAQQRLLGIELTAGALDPDLVPEMARRLEPLLERARAGDPPSDARLLSLVIAWLGISDPPQLVRSLAELAIAPDPLIDDSHGTSIGWVAAALQWIDELELAELWLDQAIETADRRGAVVAGAIATMNRAVTRYHRGGLDGSLRDGERALEIYRYGWTSWPWSTPVLARTQIAMGDLDGAERTIGLGQRAGEAAPDHAFLLEALARLELARGDPRAALSTALTAGAVGEQRYVEEQPRLFEWRRLAALAAYEDGDADRARALIEPDVEALRATGPARQLGAALTVAGTVAGGHDGIELLSEAADLLEASPAQLQQAETLIAFGGALRRAGRRSAAREPLYRALELAAGMGAGSLEVRARDELRRLGLRPRRAERSGVDSLTPSERRVAELATEGLSTPQIAHRLHVTANTVETHLAHIYRKLSISGRSGLSDAFAESSTRV
jgi:DNA-binding CsgD family transcriptional regulator/tetratricopeptide (TPR) repeat protein